MNQLVRANDGFANLTSTYTYDLSGNILERNEYDYTTGAPGTPTDTVAYTYNTTWRDQLASYTYNEQGIRTSKTVNNAVTNFSYNGSMLMAQVTGSGAGQVKQLYSYDANCPVAGRHSNSSRPM